MSPHDYFRAFRRRWLVILVCTVVAAGIMWLVTPANATSTPRPTSYTATATLLVGADDTENGPGVSMGRVALYLTTGEIPKLAAQQLGYTGDPAVLASGLTVTPDLTALAMKISATASDGDRAAAVANAFAKSTVKFFEKPRPGAENVNVSILQVATPIANKSGGGFVVPPGRGIRTLLAGALGLLVGLALALLIDRLDSRLRNRDEIHDALRMPIIAEIPKMSRSQRSRGAIVAEDPLSVYADGYRAARTALVHTASRQIPGEYTPRRSAASRATNDARLILVTSAFPGEGKSTSAANLAASFAETGLTVLVLDADLRSPDAHNHFDVPQGGGISDFITDHGDTPLSTLIRPTSIPGVRIITAGTRLANPASLASRMGVLLDEARDLADVILVDSAPLLAASDVFDVLPMVDTVLLIVRSGRLTETSANRVAELLGRFQVPVSGAVIVGAKVKRRKDGYGYGYGYGYGDSKKNKKRTRKVTANVAENFPVEPDILTDGAPSGDGRARRPA
ncbi:MAG TPA: P-loop NTPase [Ornithinibacter sp.]|nr:P-loop NTPase [Ornithinibacter sp.]